MPELVEAVWYGGIFIPLAIAAGEAVKLWMILGGRAALWNQVADPIWEPVKIIFLGGSLLLCYGAIIAGEIIEMRTLMSRWNVSCGTVWEAWGLGLDDLRFQDGNEAWCGWTRERFLRRLRTARLAKGT